jgi:hypothetical protein
VLCGYSLPTLDSEFNASKSVIAALIAQTLLFSHAYNSSDFQFYSWKTSIASQIVLCLSYITPCLPYLKPFLESLDSGMLNNDGIRRVGKSELNSKSYGSAYTMDMFSSKGKSSKKSSNKTVQSLALPNIASVAAQELEDNKSTPSLESKGSQAKIITKTTSIMWTEEHERAPLPVKLGSPAAAE